MKTARLKAPWLCVCLLLLAGPLAVATEDEAPSNWTPDDILLAESAGGFAVSPDGSRVVWIKQQMDKEHGSRISNLMLSDLGDGSTVQLTRGKDNHFGPRWSPDGTKIAFLSTRALPKKKENAAGTQLWLLDARGGEPWNLTESERDILSFAWRRNEAIVYLAEESPALHEKTRKEQKDTTRIIEDADHKPPVRIFQLELKTGKSKRVTGNGDWMERLEVSPDGRWAATLHQRSLSFEFDHKVPPVLMLTDLESGEMRSVGGGERIYPVSVIWAKDSAGFYYSTQYSSHKDYFTATISLLHYYDLGSAKSVDVNLDWEWGLGGFDGSLQATEDGFIALLAEGVRYRPARYTRRGDSWRREDLSGEHTRNLFDWTLGSDGKSLVYDHSTPSLPTQWYRARLDGTGIVESSRLTRLNPTWENRTIHKTEVIQWTGAKGDSVEGILYYPIGYEEGRRYPLMLVIHGGPTGVDMDTWVQNHTRMTTLLTQRGAFVLKVNYHGSGNYGLAWVESIGEGKYYDLEHKDLMGGVEHLIELGLVDAERLGTMGWSNGSILTTDLITRYPGRFKVASAGAGDVEWISDWGNVMFGASFDNYYFGRAPYEDPQVYIRKSPYFKLKDVTTPTIIHTGTEDVNVPPGQSWSHYRVMQQATDTPVKFLVYPGEPHGFRKYVHQRRKLLSDLEWFDRYLFGTYETPNEALKDGSPLDVALKTRTVKRSGGRYGETLRKTLIPEVVRYEGMDVGRFEVTRAQFAAFDKSFGFEAGTENHPAAGISYGQATAYAAWLSQLTGAAYRLPNATEAAKLYSGDRQGENTLDYWAGYAPNPDDVERLRRKLGELGEGAPLLTEAGRFRGRGKQDLVFDLEGNAAEWCVNAEGKGYLAGGSAVHPAESGKADEGTPVPYRGFRIVREAAKD